MPVFPQATTAFVYKKNVNHSKLNRQTGLIFGNRPGIKEATDNITLTDCTELRCSFRYLDLSTTLRQKKRKRKITSD